MTWLLVLAMVLFTYPFVLYPLILRFIGKPVRWPDPDSHAELPPGPPTVALVICALNEENGIAAKLRNSLDLDYPEDRLAIYLINDGSQDRTREIARQFEPRVRIIHRTERIGKVANLNAVIPSLAEDVVVQSDANVIYHPKAVRHLVARLADPSVGCVSGRIILTETSPELRPGEEGYYSMEWFLQEKASAIYSMCGVDGAMHAYRRHLFEPCPDDTLIEDFVEGMQFVRKGFRVVYQPDATAWEQGPASLAEESRRKVRIAAGAAQALIRRNGVPSRAPLRFWWVWTSHKLLRWLSPLIGAFALALAASSSGHWLSRSVLAGFVLVTVLAGIRWVTAWSNALLDAGFYFVFGQIAMARGLLRGVLGTQSVLWDKARR
jgi:cellulose synthase/poly-beta-1,6-N-acetylglucosamine synthase-like glycosyltransferase